MTRNNSIKFKSVKVYLEFDPRLQPITGVDRTLIELTEGTPFVMLLHAVLDSYPDLAANYAFNMLGFEINGKTPNPFSILDANDVVSVCLPNFDISSDSHGTAYYH